MNQTTLPAVQSREDLVMAYIGMCTARGAASEHTKAAYKRAIERFCAWLGKNPADATPEDVERWRESMLAGGARHRSVMLRLSAIRTMYKALCRKGICQRSPAEYVKAPKPETSAVDGVMKKLVFPDQMIAVLVKVEDSPAGRRDRVLLLVLYLLGLRVSEVAGLDWTDFKGDTVTFRAKGGQDRELALPGGLKTLLEALRPSLDASGPVFRVDGARFSVRGIQKMVEVRLAAAGLAGRSPHCLRHSCATAAAIGGASPYAIQDQLGHASQKTTAIYTQVAGRFLEAPSLIVAKAVGI